MTAMNVNPTHNSCSYGLNLFARSRAGIVFNRGNKSDVP